MVILYYVRKDKTDNICVNTILRCVREVSFAVETQYIYIYIHIPSVSLQPYLSGIPNPCAALYCHLWPVWLDHIFLHYLINGTTFKVTEYKMWVLIFCTTFLKQLLFHEEFSEI